MARHVALTEDQHDAIMNEVNDFLRNKDVKVSHLARACGLAQPFVWNVANGNFQMETQRLRRLMQYIRIKNEGIEAADEGLRSAIDRYFSAGGDLTLLRSSVEMLAGMFEAQQGGARGPGAAGNDA